MEGCLGLRAGSFSPRYSPISRGAIDQVEALHLVDGGDGRGERHGVGLVGVAVGEVVVLEVIGDLAGGGAEAQRDIGRGDALGGGEDVGLDAPVFTANHLPVRPQPVMTSSAMSRTPWSSQISAQLGQVLGRRHQDAVGADDGLHDDRGDVALVGDHVLEVVGAGDSAAGVGVLDGAVVAVDLGGEDDAAAFAAGLDGQRRGSPVAAIEALVDPW